MKCEDVRERLMEAAASELAGHGESAVARHVRRCSACRALAARVLDETARLAADLGNLEPRMSEEDAVRLALEGRAAVEGRAIRGTGRRWRQWAPVPIAAAAAIAALVLTRGPRHPGLEEVGGSTSGSMSETAPVGESLARLSVDVPDEGSVAVFETSDPSITVIWFY